MVTFIIKVSYLYKNNRNTKWFMVKVDHLDTEMTRKKLSTHIATKLTHWKDVRILSIMPTLKLDDVTELI